MGFDFLTMAATISKLERSGQIGSTTPSKTYTFDGILEGKDYVPYNSGNGFLKVSSDTPDLHQLEKVDTVVGVVTPTDPSVSIIEGTAENNELFGARGYALLFETVPIIVVITDTLNSPIPSTGLYFYCSGYPENIETAAIELVIAETVHPIDPKFLPGAWLPVVELEAVGNLTGELVELSENDCAKLNEVFGKKSPVIISTAVGGYPCSAVYSYSHVNGWHIYGAQVALGDGFAAVQVINQNGIWGIAAMLMGG